MVNKLASFENDIDFRRLWKIGTTTSVVLMVIAIGALVGRGLNLGIDFEGGSAWEVTAPGVSISEARDVLAEVDASNAKIQEVDEDRLRIQDEADSAEEVAVITAALAELGTIELQETVGPTWGDEISEKALRALIYFFILIAVYIAVRLEWRMAVGALVAMVHDIVISVGVYAVFHFEVTPATVIAFLTILGYSLYDTIVVFDKVNENTNRPAVAQRQTVTDLMSLSLNQVLMRSLNTSITSVLPVLSMLLVGAVALGAVTLAEFSIALLVGLLSGAYSSIFVAAPVVAALKEREPRYATLRQRLETQAGRKVTSPTGEQVDLDDAEATGATKTRTSTSAPELSGRIIPPRPRKKGKRR